MPHLLVAVGAWLLMDGELWRVTRLSGSHATLVSREATACAVPLDVLATEAVAADGPPHHATDDDAVDADAVTTLVSQLSDSQRVAFEERLGDANEVRTGYRSGRAERPAEGEPRPGYEEGTARNDRAKAKAAERGVSMRTVQRWASGVDKGDLRALVDQRWLRATDPLGRVPQEWVAAARQVLHDDREGSLTTVSVVIQKINLRAMREHGLARERLPGPTTARRVLEHLAESSYLLTGPTKRRREAALRPSQPYGHLRASRPGEFVVLDTTRLDVIAICPVTLQPISLELSVAMDLVSRTICAIRLSETTKYVDAALLLYETLTPDSWTRTDCGLLPYVGAPEAIVIGEQAPLREAASTLPAVAPDALIIDHGRIYFCNATLAACAALGIDVQPARKRTPTDKGPLERFFRTLSEQLLALIRGFKGRDLNARGDDPEADAALFPFEIEQIIREWIATFYHRTPHDGCRLPEVPGMDLTPLQMLELARARAGNVRIPLRDDLVYDLLPVHWRKIQHYGIDLLGHRYDGPALDPYRGKTSPYTGRRRGFWPVRRDPDDVRTAFFQDPNTREWHPLRWRYADDFHEPMSQEALTFVRRAAREMGVDDASPRMVIEMIQEWEAGRFTARGQRRVVGRQAAQRPHRAGAPEALEAPSAGPPTDDPVSPLALPPGDEMVVGDDDFDDELETDDVDDIFGMLK